MVWQYKKILPDDTISRPRGLYGPTIWILKILGRYGREVEICRPGRSMGWGEDGGRGGMMDSELSRGVGVLFGV